MKYLYLPILFSLAVAYTNYFDSKNISNRSPASQKELSTIQKIQKYFSIK